MKTTLNCRNRTFRTVVCGAVICSMLTPAICSRCAAQDGKEIAKGLLRALIESQLEKSQRRSGRPTTQLAPRPGSVTPEINQLRPITATFAQEAATLGALLQTDSRRSVQARRYLPDAIRLQAEAAALKQRTASQNNHALVIDDFRSLNNDWGVLSHQLGQCRNISPQTTAVIKRMTALDGQYCSILGIQQQYNSQELTRAAYLLTTYVRDLVDDVQHTPFPRSSNRQLLRELGRLSQKGDYFAGLVSQGAQFSTIVTEYKTLYEDWLEAEKLLADYSGHTIARNMRRIRDVHQTMHELLRLEIGIDKNLVLHLIHDADHDSAELFRMLTLEHLIALPDGGSIPDAADALSGTIQNIDDLVHRDESIQAVGEAWAYVDEAWSQFAFYLSAVRDPTIATRVQDIGETLQSLQQALGITIQYDRNALIRSASTLEAFSEQLATALRRWQSRPGTHDRSLVSKAEKMVNLFHHIEQSIQLGRRGIHNLRECDEAISLWQQIRPILKTCDTPEREQFDHIAATLTAEVVRLRTMLDSQ